jgi:hypothetical protein
MLLIAQSIAEYGGAGGGIVGAIERLATDTSAWVSNSLAEDTAFWIAGVCLLGFLLFRRR